MSAYHCAPGSGSQRSASITAWWRKRQQTEPLPERWLRIAALRARGLTQRAIAREVGMWQGDVSKTLKKIARRQDMA
jgi:DNA-binding NarL/FixJ family response regulator